MANHSGLIGITRGKERANDIDTILERIWATFFTKLMKDIQLHSETVQIS